MMQLARRVGGVWGGREIRPVEVGVYLQSIRDGMAQGELGKRKPPEVAKKPPPTSLHPNRPVTPSADRPAIKQQVLAPPPDSNKSIVPK